MGTQIKEQACISNKKTGSLNSMFTDMKTSLSINIVNSVRKIIVKFTQLCSKFPPTALLKFCGGG